jgi:hypothetical protein
MSNEALDMFGDEVNEAEDKFFESGGQDENTEQVQDEGQADGQTDSSQEVKPEPTEQAQTEQANTVPHSRFHAEMMERQRAEQEAANLRAQNTQLMQLKQELDEIRKGKATEEESNAFEEDPLGYMKNKVDALEQEKVITEQQSAQFIQQQQFVEQINTWATSQVSAFSREHEDYGDAFNFVVENRRAELLRNAEILGIQADHAMIENQLQQESMGLIMQAAQAKNPAEIVYNLAMAKGYTKAQAQAAAQNTDETLQQKIDKIEKGQQASSSLSGTTSSPDAGELSVSDISSMSDDEFDAFWDKYEREARKG